MDHQVEVRSDYYARLAVHLSLSLDPLAHYLHTHDDTESSGWSTPLTLSVLARLAARHYPGALDLLRDYVSYGYWWEWTLSDLVELNDSTALEGLDEVICRRFQSYSGEEMQDASNFGYWFRPSEEHHVWDAWRASNPCIAHLLNEWERATASYPAAKPDPHPNPAQFTVDELLLKIAEWRSLRSVGWRNLPSVGDLVAAKVRPADEAVLLSALSTKTPAAWYLALRGLQTLHRAEPLYHQILDNAVGYLEALPDESAGFNRHKRRAIYLALLLMPPEMTLPLARRWFNSNNRHLSYVANDLLREYATPDDLPMVRSALTEHLQADPENYSSYFTCSMLDILSLFAGIGHIPEVENVFLQTAYSYARSLAAGCMKVNAPDWFAETYAYECLWDCEESTRQIGCESVSLAVPGAREGLQSIVDDPFEDHQLKQAAAIRLAMT